jgi:type IV pilus assembly protein PilB
MALPMKLRDPLLSRIKIMAKLDIAEKRLPQDGRIKIKMKVEDRSRDLDFRVSVLPTLWGEKIVLRLLDKSKLMLDMNKPDTNIMTAEDPVEFNLPGINQVQIRDNIGLNFAAALRSFLRQDPNIILVGEIRDYETAEIAVKASLTGHLVLSTLHTNDAPSTVSRLVNMGIEPFLVGTAVNLIQAQRLVRRVCSKCKQDITAEVPAKTLIDIGLTPEQVGTFKVMKGKGCGTCNGTGYKGRVGLYEVMEISEGIRDLIMVGATAVELKKKALEEGMLTLRMSGVEKIKNGVTTLEEVLRETVL